MTAWWLNVPFEEKDEAKSLGAKWSSSAKKWFVPKGISIDAFGKWLCSPPVKVFFPIDIMETVDGCWNCMKKTKIVGLRVGKVQDYDWDEPLQDKFFLTDVEYLPGSIYDKARTICPSYKLDYSKTAGTKYYMNHCEHCGAKFGDFFLFNEPPSPFLNATRADEVVSSQRRKYVEIPCSLFTSSVL